ncbi:MAG: FG-GAP repeat protein, partial [Lysobacterales bacterium]
GVWSQQAYLKASNPDDGDAFGNSVAISKGWLVVGARREESNATGVDGDQSNNFSSDSGAAYVFTRATGAWGQQAYVKASNTEARDNFGNWVAISGDTLVVAAHHEDSNATGVDGDETNNLAGYSGAVYMFEFFDLIFADSFEGEG